MKLSAALVQSLGDRREPVFSLYRIGLIVHRLYQEGRYKREPISHIRRAYAKGSDVSRLVNELIKSGVLSTSGNLPNGIYKLVGQNPEVKEVVGIVDPFCYVSHLSAMAYYGLTDRLPNMIYISTPKLPKWREMAESVMRRDIGGELDRYYENGMPTLSNIVLKQVGRHRIYTYASSRLSGRGFRNVADQHWRISTIGRTFLDMLRDPDLCGGMNHVLEVYDLHAEAYVENIVNELDRHGNSIDKVRAGYILDERLGLKHETVDKWVNYAQRGGSRKLDSSADYESKWSEKWCLSLNAYERSKD